MSRDQVSEDDLLALMLTEPRLIRRPLIEVDGELLPPVSGAAKIKEALTRVLDSPRRA